MKNIIALISFMLVLCAAAQFDDVGFVSTLGVSPEAAGGGCTTETAIYAGTTTGQTDSENGRYMVQRFNSTNAITVCKVIVRGAKFGTDATIGGRTIRVGFFTVSANEPDTQVGSWSSTQYITNLTTSEADVIFDDGVSVSLSGSETDYFVGIDDSGGGAFDGAGFRWYFQSGPTKRSMVSDDLATWSEVSPDNPLKFKLYE